MLRQNAWSHNFVEKLDLGGKPLSVAFVATYPPRECGIATFAQDLLRAINQHPLVRDCFVAAMDRAGEDCAYESPVRWVVPDDSPVSYASAARQINEAGHDFVCLQHEFGIFGGSDGEHVRRLIDCLRVPVVTTLHTVLPEPGQNQRDIIRFLAQRSRRLIVMNKLAIGLLERVYGIDRSQIGFIPHGAPEFPRNGKEQAKGRLGLTGRKVLSTFGLIGRGKGLEHAINAMKKVAANNPDALYCILGKTHPGVVRSEGGDHYRTELKQLAGDQGISENVRFVNQYLEKPELIRWLTATDVYVTPYLNPDQIVSGTLAYAMVAGKAIISTPYLYAKELLSDGHGVLVPFRDQAAIAESANWLLASKSILADMERRAYQRGRTMTWRAVADAYVKLFHEIAGVRPAVLRRPLTRLVEAGMHR